MPEGDTVYLAGRRLDRALRGRTLLRTDLRVPRYATADLSGSVVEEVASRGKHLFFRLGEVTLHTHFRMDGTWHLYRPGERWKEPGFQARVVLETEDRVAVGFRLPVVELIVTGDEDAVVGHLGPDLLGDDWDEAEALANLTAEPFRRLDDVLLDQRVMAGLGNIYKSEICFMLRLHPATRVEDVRSPVEVIRLAKELIEANRTTGNQITTGDRRPGFGRWVYGRVGRRCKRCGTSIVIERDLAHRITYVCPSCQPRPS